MAIVRIFCNLILQITLLLSVLLLFRGHNFPGGGFIGALMAATGIGFHILSFGKPPPRLINKHIVLIFIGLLCLLMSLVLALFTQQAILTSLWFKLPIGHSLLKIGTPLVFDIGIYLSILGSLIWIMSGLEKSIDD